MKKLILILGGVICLPLIVVAMYVGLTIGLNVYMAYAHQKQVRITQDQMAQAQTRRMQQQIASLGNNMTPDVVNDKQKADALAGKLPTLFDDPEGYKTEDNWLATGISREIAEMAFFTMHPDAPPLDLKIKVEVTPDKPQVHLEINGFGADGTISSNLAPAFAWDPQGYAPLARQLLGTTSGTPAVPITDENDVLSHLLTLTGSALAAEDVRISGNLQQHPASWQEHEAAALVLTALALREQAGVYSDNRTLLNRATAHLALAQALRGDQQATGPGLIADAAVRTLAGRELDALAHLDDLSVKPDLPLAAKQWITALRLLAKQDWRVADVSEKSPLLLKIAWFQMLQLDLVPDVAARHLKNVVPQSASDPNTPPDQDRTNPEALIPDWGRIAGRSPFYDLTDEDTKSAEYRLDLEFHEMDDILHVEGGAPFDLQKLASLYSEAEADTVSHDASGKAIVHVIGLGTFKAASRRHLFAGLLTKNTIPGPSDQTLGDLAEAQNAFTKFDRLFQGVPGYELARLHLGFVDDNEMKTQYDEWLTANKLWRVWEVPFPLVIDMPGYGLVTAFYRHAVPFGTVYDPSLYRRYTFINAVNPESFPPYDTPELEAIKKLPIQKAFLAVGDYNQKYNALIRSTGPQGPKPFEQELLKLAPDEYILVQDHVPDDKLMATTARFLDYNMDPIERIERLDTNHLSDTDRIAILRKHVALEPAFGFRAGVFLRSKGLDDEAAGMEREALSTADDPIGISNSVLPLVDYDLRHGLNDEALKIAQSAGQTDSEIGLYTYGFALEKIGRLDEAEAVAKRDSELYSDPFWLLNFHLRHRDRYPEIYADTLKTTFPNDLIHAMLANFSGNPKSGDQIQSDSDTLKGAGLQPGDIIVALDGYRVDSNAQYTFVRALTMDSKMDIIFWRAGKYLELQALVPGRLLLVNIGDYKPN